MKEITQKDFGFFIHIAYEKLFSEISWADNMFLT